MLRLIEPTSGRVRFEGEDLGALSQRALRRRRRDMQIVFQDPYAALDPRVRIGATLEEPLDHPRRSATGARGARACASCSPWSACRTTRWRAIRTSSRAASASASASPARSRSTPSSLVLDEPVSALDVSIQSQILNLLVELRERLALSYLFISHDLAVIRHISDRVAVMYLGQIVELGAAATIYRAAAHPYTQALLSAIPQPDPARRRAPHRAARATCPTRSIRRPAARSIRAARRPSSVAATRRRPSGMSAAPARPQLVRCHLY